ncbi:peptidase S24/S26A/S26B/S26C [Fimicolochytrium jonesii]|uniref:peptidase S24/S26A/S26B/S26C n=1 Tax=Fimicolochytrium jonesii TaxID=1396493 RepID=UPI0022FDBFEB|nr:peptidase S24/S26A/S26B/S26C [Fimicolochytrium jonesii]KAI8822972.1 peptidase S24/S26A/S26B/S26C [Fimicolochytrium jonesii]
MITLLRRLRPTLYLLPPTLLFLTHGFSVGIISGRSMQPTLNPDTSHTRRDIVLLDKRPASPVTQSSNSPTVGIKRGDVVFLANPYDEKMKLVKRVVAVAGDVVRPRRGSEEGVMGGGEDWWARHHHLVGHDDSHNSSTLYVRIPRGHVWVESDEPFRGVDSNVFGPVPLGLVESKVVAVLWPTDRFGRLQSRSVKPGRVLIGGGGKGIGMGLGLGGFVWDGDEAIEGETDALGIIPPIG